MVGGVGALGSSCCCHEGDGRLLRHGDVWWFRGAVGSSWVLGFAPCGHFFVCHWSRGALAAASAAEAAVDAKGEKRE